MKEIEYIFDLVINELDFNLFNDNLGSLMAFRQECITCQDKSKLINMFHPNTLLAYDTSLRLFANLLFEKIPNERNITLTNIPEFVDFKKWFGSLEFDDFVGICFMLKDQQMVDIKTAEDLQFLVNVFITNRELEYVQPNKTNK